MSMPEFISEISLHTTKANIQQEPLYGLIAFILEGKHNIIPSYKGQFDI